MLHAMAERMISDALAKPDVALEMTLRPSIFAEFTGAGTPDAQTSGINEITGGTGKYAGIHGNGPWMCKGAGANGEYQCVQRLDYRLP